MKVTTAGDLLALVVADRNERADIVSLVLIPSLGVVARICWRRCGLFLCRETVALPIGFHCVCHSGNTSAIVRVEQFLQVAIETACDLLREIR